MMYRSNFYTSISCNDMVSGHQRQMGTVFYLNASTSDGHDLRLSAILLYNIAVLVDAGILIPMEDLKILTLLLTLIYMRTVTETIIMNRPRPSPCKHEDITRRNP